MRLAKALLPLLCCTIALPALAAPPVEGTWQKLFDGKTLDGWIPKINHHPLGDNYRDTFRAEDGMIRVSHAKYTDFRDQFAHLIYKTPFSSYRLRLEYRFVGTDQPGGPPWSVRNSGVMFHGQSPETIGLNQPFPVSFEFQLLNGDGKEVRPTGNVCTPGTALNIDGAPLKTHCATSSAPTFSGSDWVQLELEVHGSKHVIEKINGKTILEYGDLRLDPVDLRAMELHLASPKLETELRGGYISLQGEGHPIDFRNIEIMVLPD
jgi:hypothetical protein